MKKHLSILLFLLPLSILAQETTFRIDSLPHGGILLESGWKWHAGDNPDFAKPDFDDSKWESIQPTKDVLELSQIQDGEIAWMRLQIEFDSSMLLKPLVLKIERQVIASELYLDGRIIDKFGSLNPKKVEASYVSRKSIGITNKKNTLTIAVRFAFQKSKLYNRLGSSSNQLFASEIISIKDLEDYHEYFSRYLSLLFLKGGMFLIMFVLHLAFFIFYPSLKANLYFSGMTLFYAAHIFIEGWSVLIPPSYPHLDFIMLVGLVRLLVYPISYGLLLIALYTIFNFKRDFVFWISILGCVVILSLSLSNYVWGVQISEGSTTLIMTLSSLYVGIRGVLAKKDNASIVLLGMISSILLLGYLYLGLHYFYTLDWFDGSNQADIIQMLGTISIPIAISIFLGAEFSVLHKSLNLKIKENEKLSSEKQQILASQNETLEKQVESRTAELKASQAQLIQSEKMASLGELTAGIAHEIQNPLNFVNNFSEVSEEMIEEVLGERLKVKGERDEALEVELLSDIKENLTKINHHGNRASSIVKGMLEHSRTSSGKKELTDINALADEYLRLAYHGLRAKEKDFNAEMVTEFDENVPKIEVIPQDIGRVLLNLINNAFQACAERSRTAASDKYKPTVSISTSQEPKADGSKQIAIGISDNGPGIPDAIKDKIFQPFFTTKDTGKGTGLGLSLAYDIVKAHGGEIKVESEVGKGTEFIIQLPA